MSEAKSVSAQQTVYPILIAVCAGHFLNDLLQAVLPAAYPLLKGKYALSYTQIGFITFAFQITSSLLQPFVGAFTDKRPQPHAFVGGMIFAFVGITILAFANNFFWILVAACSIGIGSSIFHPEASRVAYYASGGRRGLAQSIFQLGGNGGTSIGPLLIALIAIPFGQFTIAFFALFAVIGAGLLYWVGNWYKNYLQQQVNRKNVYNDGNYGLSKGRVTFSVVILLILITNIFLFRSKRLNSTCSFTCFPSLLAPCMEDRWVINMGVRTSFGSPSWVRLLLHWHCLT